MLDRKKLFLIAMLLTILGPAFIIKSPISYVPFVFIMLLLVISYSYILIILKSFKIRIDKNSLKSFERLSEDHYSIGIENKSILVMPRVSFSISLSSIDGYVVRDYVYDFIVRSKEKIEVKLKMQLPHVGKFKITISKIKFYGFIDLLFLYKSVKWSNEVIVTPKIHSIENYEINTVNPIFSVDYNVPHKIKGGEFNDVREYIPGDSIKNIHWKLSAHSGSLFTKIINTDAVNGISIYMDLPNFSVENYNYTADVYDCILESSYAAAIYSLDKEYAVNFIFFEAGSLSYRYIKSYEDLSEFVYLFPEGQKDCFLELLIDEYSNSSISFDNMLILTYRPSIELAYIIADCRMKGKIPYLFWVRARGSDGAYENHIKDHLKKSEIKYSIINDAKEFALALGGVR
jgi:uncharacterized protein (DUF58 family)